MKAKLMQIFEYLNKSDDLSEIKVNDYFINKSRIEMNNLAEDIISRTRPYSNDLKPLISVGKGQKAKAP
jgi:hypothetical protein